MTTLEDTTDALLANPLDPALHHAVCDRLEEETPDARKALLWLVCENKSNDGPRLAFACWCENHGEPERAEFIRVQCWLAANPSCGSCTGSEWFNGKPCAECDQRELYRDRRDDLLYRDGLATGHIGIWLWTRGAVRGLVPAGATISDHITFNRGFVESVTCTADAWLKHADAILAEHPVEKVQFTSIPGHEEEGELFSKCLIWLKGREKKYRWRDASHRTSELNTYGRVCSAALALYRLEFPGVEFTPPTATHVDEFVPFQWPGNG